MENMVLSDLKIMKTLWRVDNIPKGRSRDNMIGILKRTPREVPFPFPRVTQQWSEKSGLWCGMTGTAGTFPKIRNYKQRYKQSSFSSSVPGTMIISLDKDVCERTVRFGKVEIIFYENE